MQLFFSIIILTAYDLNNAVWPSDPPDDDYDDDDGLCQWLFEEWELSVSFAGKPIIESQCKLFIVYDAPGIQSCTETYYLTKSQFRELVILVRVE